MQTEFHGSGPRRVLQRKRPAPLRTPASFHSLVGGSGCVGSHITFVASHAATATGAFFLDLGRIVIRGRNRQSGRQDGRVEPGIFAIGASFLDLGARGTTPATRRCRRFLSLSWGLNGSLFARLIVSFATTRTARLAFGTVVPIVTVAPFRAIVAFSPLAAFRAFGTLRTVAPVAAHIAIVPVAAIATIVAILTFAIAIAVPARIALLAAIVIIHVRDVGVEILTVIIVASV